MPQGSVLEPVLFSIYMNDLLILMMYSKICNYAIMSQSKYVIANRKLMSRDKEVKRLLFQDGFRMTS